MQKCPHLVTTPPRFNIYDEYSEKAKKIYNDYTNQVESFGLDECFLDVTGSKKILGDGMEIAKLISGRIKKELGITVTIGVSYNKMFAKIASDLKKPDEINLVTKENYKDIIWPLPANRLLYVGKASSKALYNSGIFTIGDIARTDIKLLERILGKRGLEFHRNANGNDQEIVKDINNHRLVKSIGNGTTTAKDLTTPEEVSKVLLMLSESVAARMREQDVYCNVVVINIKYNDFTSIDRQRRLEFSTNTAYTLHQISMELYKENPNSKGVRALSIRTTDLERKEGGQLSFLKEVEAENKQRQIETTVDKIRDKLGWKSISRASLMKEKEAKTVDPTDKDSLNSAAFRIDR